MYIQTACCAGPQQRAGGVAGVAGAARRRGRGAVGGRAGRRRARAAARRRRPAPVARTRGARALPLLPVAGLLRLTHFWNF